MVRLRAGVMVLLASLLGASLLVGDDKKGDEKDPPPKVRGMLPAHFKKLGLTDAQKDKIYGLQASYRAKIDDLEKKKKLLKVEEKTAIEKVLTAEQLKRLKELRSGEKPTETPAETPKDKPKKKDK